MARGLILFAHGARDARWAAPFEAVAERVRANTAETAETANTAGATVRLAFLELMQPSLGDAVAELVAKGCTELHVVPLFLGSGGHVRQDLPALVAAQRAQHAGATITLHPPIGEEASVIAAIALAASQHLST